jgi:GntR family transcriptional regulator
MREAGISEATVDSIVIEPRTIPPRDVAERLGLASNARVVKRSRRYLALGEPLQKAVSWIPLDLAKNTLIMQADTGPGGIYARLEERGIRLERFVEEIASRMPSPQESHELRVRPGIPVFVITRVAYDQDGRAVEVCETVARSDRYVLSYDLPAN